MSRPHRTDTSGTAAAADIFEPNAHIQLGHPFQLLTLIFETFIVGLTGLGIFSIVGSHALNQQILFAACAYPMTVMAIEKLTNRHLRFAQGTSSHLICVACTCLIYFEISDASRTTSLSIDLVAWFAFASAMIAVTRNAKLKDAANARLTRRWTDNAFVVGGVDQSHTVVASRNLSQGVGLADAAARSTALTEIASRIVDGGVTDVLITLPSSASTAIEQTLAALRFLPVTVRMAPHGWTAVAEDRRARSAMAVMARPPFSKSALVIKRAIDVTGAACLLVLLIPLFAVVASLVKLDSSGPVFFKQARTGQFGRSFMMFKFRSLHVAQADHGAEQLVGRGDRRVTRVGRYLRKFSLDELPQLLNVVLGSMSLVGPRPHASRAKADGRLYAEVRPDYLLRYRAKPGMTGWAQVNGWRGNTDTAEKLSKRVEYDFDYIQRWSLLMDFRILVLTIPSVLMPPADNT